MYELLGNLTTTPHFAEITDKATKEEFDKEMKKCQYRPVEEYNGFVGAGFIGLYNILVFMRSDPSDL